MLRQQDGQRISAKLKVVSRTGGLLSVPYPLDTGSNGRLLFLTSAGSVLASIEMLTPLAWKVQPFRFVALDGDAERKLQAEIGSSIDRRRVQHVEIERSRSW